MKKIFLLITVSIFAFSCMKGEEKGDVPAALLIKSIAANPDKSNALRENITVELTKDGTAFVEYWKKGDDQVMSSQKVAGQMRPSFTLMFMEPETEYEFAIKVVAGDQRTRSDVYSFKTRELPVNFEQYELFENELDFNGYIFTSQRMAGPGNLILLNKDAKVVWYQTLAPNLTATNYDTLSKTFTCMVGGEMDNLFVIDRIATVDLYGNITFNKTREQIGNKLYHHDVRLMPDGNYIGINFVKKPFDLTKWGGSTEEIVTGDGYTIFDKNGAVIKEWDCFGTINPQDDPNIMNAFPMLNINLRDDWLHANAIEICPDGNYIMSMNMMSQIWKINSKTGETMWRLGVNGDVSMPKEMTQNMQHSCNIAPDGDLVFFDNNGGVDAASRIIKAKVDDNTKSAVPTFIINLPKDLSSFNQSSAYMMDENHVLFGSTVTNNIGVYEKTGKLVWRVNATHQFFRAQYISKINFD